MIVLKDGKYTRETRVNYALDDVGSGGAHFDRRQQIALLPVNGDESK